MESFLDKSNESLSSADILIKQEYYASTVNRAYYGYFQFLMHTLFEKLNKDRAQFELAANDSKEGSHVRASNLIIVLIQRKLTSQKYKWFQITIKELKQKRINADYYNIATTLYDGATCIKWANELIECVQENIKE
jgi:hypothetical protein